MNSINQAFKILKPFTFDGGNKYNIQDIINKMNMIDELLAGCEDTSDARICIYKLSKAWRQIAKHYEAINQDTIDTNCSDVIALAHSFLIGKIKDQSGDREVDIVDCCRHEIIYRNFKDCSPTDEYEDLTYREMIKIHPRVEAQANSAVESGKMFKCEDDCPNTPESLKQRIKSKD